MQDKILSIIRDYVRIDHLKPMVEDLASSLRDLRLDDIDLGGICVAIEDKFGIVIHDEEMRAWNMVADVVRCVVGKVGEEV